jgi:capsular exopolysaccharide synthesis family protein
MELEKYLSPLLKWWWLIVIATVVATVSSFLATTQQTPVYKSRTTLMVGSSISNLNPSSGDVYLSQYLSGVYADFANREPIQKATKEALGIDWLPVYTSRVIPNSQIIEITVTADNPEISQVVAEELAHQLILQSPASGIDNQKRQDFIENQLNILETQIVDTRASIEDLQQQLATLNSARQIADTQSQINSLSSKLDTMQANYANLLSSTPQGAANTLTILEPAQLGYPDQPNRLIPIFLASAIGFSLAAGAAYIIEYLDQTIQSEEDIQRAFGVPVIGYIMKLNDETKKSDYIATYPRSPVAEAFRSLRTNLIFAIAKQNVKTLLISSVDMGEGKTTLIANLAISFAQAEKRITVIDADLRRPSLHNQLGLPQIPGLAEALETPKSPDKYTSKIYDERINVLTAGKSPLNPAELLASPKLDQIIEKFKKESEYVIIDGPPFIVTDASILASRVDGMLLIITPGKVRREVAKKIKAQFEQTGANLVGVVFNRIAPKDLKKYGNYTNYYHPYYQKADEPEPDSDSDTQIHPDSQELINNDSGRGSETQLVSETEVEHEVESNTQVVLSSEVEAANISVQQDKEELSYELAIETEPSIDPGISADTSMESDDLKKIEGIGPKVVTLLKEYGIETFSQLAEIPVEELSEILDAANLHMMNPASWPQQAKLAAAGEWEALQEFQEALKGER